MAACRRADGLDISYLVGKCGHDSALGDCACGPGENTGYSRTLEVQRVFAGASWTASLGTRLLPGSFRGCIRSEKDVGYTAGDFDRRLSENSFLSFKYITMNSTRKMMGGQKMYGGAKIPAVGTKAQVFHGTAKHTSGGLTKKDLMQTKKGRIVSRKKHAAGKKALARLRKAGFKAKKGTFKLFGK